MSTEVRQFPINVSTVGSTVCGNAMSTLHLGVRASTVDSRHQLVQVSITAKPI
jgi:hypothetical protein